MESADRVVAQREETREKDKEGEEQRPGGEGRRRRGRRVVKGKRGGTQNYYLAIKGLCKW